MFSLDDIRDVMYNSALGYNCVHVGHGICFKDRGECSALGGGICNFPCPPDTSCCWYDLLNFTYVRIKVSINLSLTNVD